MEPVEMKHLSDERFLELGLTRDAALGRGEEAHLEACAACRTRLNEEHSLSAMLAALPMPAVSEDFAAKTTRRFVEARALKVSRARSAKLVAIAACVLAVLIAPLLVVGSLPVLLTRLIVGAARAAMYLHTVVEIYARVPMATPVTLCACSAAALFFTWLLTRQFQAALE